MVINVIAIILTVVAVFLSMANPYITKMIVDDVLEARNFEKLWPLILILLGTTLGHAVARYIKQYLFEYSSQKILYDLRSDMYDKLQAQSFKYYDNMRIGHLMNRMVGDLQSIRNFLNNGYISFFESLISFFTTFSVIVTMNYKLTILMLTVLPMLFWNTRSMSKILNPLFKEIRRHFERVTTTAEENITGIRVVKAFGREEYEKEKFYKVSKGFSDANIKAADIRAKYVPRTQAINGLGSIIILLFGGYLAIKGEITVGDLVAFNGYMFMLSTPINSLNNLVNQWQDAVASMEKIFEVLDKDIEIENKDGAIVLDKVKGNIEFENVSFKYKDAPVLKNISMNIPAGSTIAIMGPTGSGKSTIINLIARFYDCTEGRVLIDGHDVRDIDLLSLRKNVGIVMQDSFLFSSSIAENIAFGNPDATMEQIEEAAKIADAHEFIMTMPDKYDTVIGERGVGLSGGQKQRIAIARAILYNPKILVFDDSTSSVDMKTEQQIQSTLKKVMKGRTSIIIAHRISSVKDADKILFIEDGQIVEEGTHDELISLGGRYYNIFIEQYKENVAS